ncbi:hypothetical protein V8G54_012191 [Vigna mungo]|uniref:Uncharacterized protein n=1 Tax=Vigna mungo TaxID=3915 RepID=A0AAQ3NQM8_VIGMU
MRTEKQRQGIARILRSSNSLRNPKYAAVTPILTLSAGATISAIDSPSLASSNPMAINYQRVVTESLHIPLEKMREREHREKWRKLFECCVSHSSLPIKVSSKRNTPALAPSLSLRKGFPSSPSRCCKQSSGVSGFQYGGERGKCERGRTDEIDLVFLFAGATQKQMGFMDEGVGVQCWCELLVVSVVRASSSCARSNAILGFWFGFACPKVMLTLMRSCFAVEEKSCGEDEDGGGGACVSSWWRCGDGWLPARMTREEDDSVRGRRLLMGLALVVTGSTVVLIVVNGDDGEIVVVATGLSSLHGCSRSDEDDDDDDGGAAESMMTIMDGVTTRVDEGVDLSLDTFGDVIWLNAPSYGSNDQRASLPSGPGARHHIPGALALNTPFLAMNALFQEEILISGFKYYWNECREFSFRSYPETLMIIHSQSEKIDTCGKSSSRS